MALLKIQRAGQITLPAKLRKALHLDIGDYLEAEAVPGGILLKPVAVVDREKAWQQVFDAMSSVTETAPPPEQSSHAQEEEPGARLLSGTGAGQ